MEGTLFFAIFALALYFALPISSVPGQRARLLRPLEKTVVIGLAASLSAVIFMALLIAYGRTTIYLFSLVLSVLAIGSFGHVIGILIARRLNRPTLEHAFRLGLVFFALLTLSMPRALTQAFGIRVYY